MQWFSLLQIEVQTAFFVRILLPSLYRMGESIFSGRAWTERKLNYARSDLVEES